MSNPSIMDQDRSAAPDSQTNNEPNESFGDILSQYEQSPSHRTATEEGRKQLEGTVVAITGETVFIDIGYKIEGTIPVAEFVASGDTVKRGDKLPVSIKGRGADGYYELSRIKVERPRDWSSLEKAFADKASIAGTVTAAVKGGLSVDVGVRAFMPASRSGARDSGRGGTQYQGEALQRGQGRRDGARHGPQPDGLRRFRGHRRRGRAAPR